VNPDIKLLSRLIVQYMSIPRHNALARDIWRHKVRRVFPYEKPILTEKLGYWLEQARRDA